MWHITVSLLIVPFVAAHLYFPPNSDMGYILPDVPEDDIEGSSAKLVVPAKFKNDAKRALMYSVPSVQSVNNTDLKKAKEWKGRWFPTPPSITTTGRVSWLSSGTFTVPPELRDEKHGVKMGISNEKCDDAKTNLELDWDSSPADYSCYTPKRRLEGRIDLEPQETCYDLPSSYIPQHYCMSDTIEYNETIPTYGPHRPLWPVFGEYQYVPPQRWLHNVEHGAVILLYHPCTEPLEVEKMKRLVRGCIFKHIITPSRRVSKERPLVLVAWGCRIEMSYVDATAVRSFIKKRALHGPEGTYPKQGSYEHKLLVKAVAPAGSDLSDSNLCPK